MTKAFASILAALLIGSAGAPMTCVGWEPSAADRHKCCLRAHHAHATDQAAADDCCARHEQGRQSEHATQRCSDDATAVAIGMSSWFDETRDLTKRAVILHEQEPHSSPPDLSPPPLRI